MDGADTAPAEIVRLQVGETWELTLPGLGTAGYRWTGAADDPAVAGAEWRLAPPDDGTRLVGRSVAEVVRVTARAPGRTVLRLEQRRAWSSDPPRATRSIQVLVEDPGDGRSGPR